MWLPRSALSSTATPSPRSPTQSHSSRPSTPHSQPDPPALPPPHPHPDVSPYLTQAHSPRPRPVGPRLADYTLSQGSRPSITVHSPHVPNLPAPPAPRALPGSAKPSAHPSATTDCTQCQAEGDLLPRYERNAHSSQCGPTRPNPNSSLSSARADACTIRNSISDSLPSGLASTFAPDSLSPAFARLHLPPFVRCIPVARSDCACRPAARSCSLGRCPNIER